MTGLGSKCAPPVKRGGCRNANRRGFREFAPLCRTNAAAYVLRNGRDYGFETFEDGLVGNDASGCRFPGGSLDKEKPAIRRGRSDDVMILDMIRTISGRAKLGAGILSTAALAPPALANEFGHAEPNQMGMMKASTAIGEYINWMHDWLLMPIITVISLFVLALLVYVCVKFNDKANPTPSRTTHSTVLELAWSIIPVLILVVIAIPSFRLLNMQLTFPKEDMIIKVTGKQWYWSYDYPKDQGDFGFDSFIKPEKDLKPGDFRMLSVDNEAVVPVGKVVRLQIVAADVIHSFVIQSFGVRIDAVPGRLNETWFKAEKEGMYYGQCSKICGKDHAFMPIAFRVVSDEKYKAWVEDAKKKFARAASPSDFADVNASVTGR